MTKSKRTSKKQKLEPQIRYEYPEFKPLATELADRVCREINERAPAIPSDMPYKAQEVLEALIEILQSRV